MKTEKEIRELIALLHKEAETFAHLTSESQMAKVAGTPAAKFISMNSAARFLEYIIGDEMGPHFAEMLEEIKGNVLGHERN